MPFFFPDACVSPLQRGCFTFLWPMEQYTISPHQPRKL